MIFELSDSLANGILFCMENQDDEFVLDIRAGKVVPISEVDESSDEKNICSLPSWSSADGYELLEQFASLVRRNRVHRELRAVLANGRGVFRNFKAVLRNYPEVERRFHRFKQQKMRARLVEWYNSLREGWGLERLEEEQCDSESLLHEDFTFRAYDSLRDKADVSAEANLVAKEILKDNPDELGVALSELWLGRIGFYCSGSVNGFVCRTLSDDFAGCLLFSESLLRTEKAVALSACFVNQSCRGLGIAKELFSLCFSDLKARGVQWFIIADSAMPDALESALMTRFGFEKTGQCFVAHVS